MCWTLNMSNRKLKDTIPLALNFPLTLMEKRSNRLIDDIFDGISTGGFVSKAIQSDDGTFIVAAAPIMDGDKVLTVFMYGYFFKRYSIPTN